MNTFHDAPRAQRAWCDEDKLWVELDEDTSDGALPAGAPQRKASV